MLGNPTNPTSVLHPADAIRALARPGRVLVVDEAFMDAVPGEPESLAGADLPGLLVLRSLTKTWALPGLRAGYALGAPGPARAGSPRTVHTGRSARWCSRPSTACASPLAVAEADAGRERDSPGTGRTSPTALAGLPGVQVHEPAAAPFLLLRVRDGERVRAGLRDRGIAVRRGDTFPGPDRRPPPGGRPRARRARRCSSTRCGPS